MVSVKRPNDPANGPASPPATTTNSGQPTSDTQQIADMLYRISQALERINANLESIHNTLGEMVCAGLNGEITVRTRGG